MPAVGGAAGPRPSRAQGGSLGVASDSTKRALEKNPDEVVGRSSTYAERDRALSHYYSYYTALYRLRDNGMDEIDLSEETVEASAPTLYGQ